MGLRLGVASSSTRAWVSGHLGRTGLLASFDVVCAREDVQQTKPHPELYTLALERLGMQPHEAFAHRGLAKRGDGGEGSRDALRGRAEPH